MKEVCCLIAGSFSKEEIPIIFQSATDRSCTKIRSVNSNNQTRLRFRNYNFIICTPDIYKNFERLLCNLAKVKTIGVITKKDEKISLSPGISQCYIDKKLKALKCVPHRESK